MEGNILALKPSTMSLPSLSLNFVEAIFALLRIGLLNTLLVGDLGSVRTGKGLAALEVGIELATAASVKGLGRDSKITRGMMQVGAVSAGAAMAVEMEMARRADEKLSRTRIMNDEGLSKVRRSLEDLICNRIAAQHDVDFMTFLSRVSSRSREAVASCFKMFL